MDSETREKQNRILIERARAGNRDAMDELLQTYESLIYRTAYAALYSSYDACDVTQNVLLKIYRTLPTFRGACSFSVWVFRITQNTIRDYIRIRGRHRTLPLEQTDPESGETNSIEIPDEDICGSPEKMAERMECAEIVQEALSRMTPEHREIIILRDVEGYSYISIAQMLGIDEGTVKSRLSRARASLKKQIILGNKYSSVSSLLTEKE